MTKPNSCDREPSPCPACGEIKAAKIFYGYPFWNDGLKEALESGENALGGCLVGSDDPAWRCNKCGHQWGLSHR